MKAKLLNIKGRLVSLEKPLVMGILNVTPDSFFAGSRQTNEAAIIGRIETIIAEGGDIIDVGAYSTRPNATIVPPDDEWRRLETALDILLKKYPEIPVSVDTFRAEIVRRSVEDYGVSMINDISGGTMDSHMFETVATLNVPYILTNYTCRQPDDAVLFFAERLQALRGLGVNDVILDPGFGFNKTLEQNYELMRHLDRFSIFFDCPLLVGISRKSMIYNLLNCTAEESLTGTTALNTYALHNGADILRVHDVKAAVEIIKIFNKIVFCQF